MDYNRGHLNHDSEFKEVKDLYNTSLLLFVHANLQGDCPAAVKIILLEEIMWITQDKRVT